MTRRNENEVVFTMGLPGAGKSTALRELGIDETHEILDPDAVKESHPDYDPKNPSALHDWSMQEIESRWIEEVLASGEGRWVVDGTGTNAERMVRRMRQARSVGFHVVLLYVHVSLETALARNAARPRTVPEGIIHRKAADIETAFLITRDYADEIRIVEND